MSLLLRKWLCLDDDEVFLNEDDYCSHAFCNPWHRIVTNENIHALQRHPRVEEEADLR